MRPWYLTVGRPRVVLEQGPRPGMVAAYTSNVVLAFGYDISNHMESHRISCLGQKRCTIYGQTGLKGFFLYSAKCVAVWKFWKTNSLKKLRIKTVIEKREWAAYACIKGLLWSRRWTLQNVGLMCVQIRNEIPTSCCKSSWSRNRSQNEHSFWMTYINKPFIHSTNTC